MKALATWCVRHRVVVLLFWLAALVGMTLLSASVGTAYSNSFTLPNTESTQALSLLQSAAPSVAGDREQIVWHTTDGTKVTDPSVQASVEAMLAKVSKVPHVTSITSPYEPEGANQISADGTTAFATVTFDRQSQFISVPAAQHFVATAQTASGPNLQVAVSGLVAESATVRRSAAPGSGSSWPGSSCSWSSARSSPWPFPCCRPSPRWAPPSA